MRQVVIGMKNGKPYVIHNSRKVEVIFRVEKKRNLKKILKTWVYRFKTALGISL